MLEPAFFIIALAALLVASYVDLRTREVPDWLNYSLIAAGIGVRTIYSLYHARWEYLVDGLLGLAAFFGLAYAMFYTGQWGGGDSKLLMGLGALLGIQLRADSFALGLVLNSFIIGAAYGLVWSLALAARHREAFLTEWHGLRRAAALNLARIALLAVAAVGIVAGFLLEDLRVRFAIFASLVFLFLLFYTFIFTKAVEKACMQRWVKPEALTEGDWIVEDVVVRGKRVCGPKDLGVSKEQMAELVRLQRQGRIKRVLMKVGIPFVPSFLMALIVTWFFGNLFMPVIGLLK